MERGRIGFRQFVYGRNATLNNTNWTETDTGNNPKQGEMSTVDLSSVSQDAYLIIFVEGRNVGDYVSLFIDDVYLEHAHGTTPITRVTESISVARGSRLTNLTVVDASNFTVGEGVYLVDKTNGQIGYAVISRIDVDYRALNFSDTMWFRKWNTTTNKYEEKDNGALDTDISVYDDVRLQQTNNGYYTFTEYPIRSSLAIDEIYPETKVSLADGSAKIFHTTSEGDKGVRYRIRCRFENVPSTMWDKLMVLLNWQRKGNMLNLHPMYDDLPSVMTGRMRLSNITKTYWDLSYRSFNFEFEELL